MARFAEIIDGPSMLELILGWAEPRRMHREVEFRRITDVQGKGLKLLVMGLQHTQVSDEDIVVTGEVWHEQGTFYRVSIRYSTATRRGRLTYIEGDKK